MKKIATCFIIPLAAQLFTISSANAQGPKNAQTTLQSPPANINIDGNPKEWGDSLRYYNQEKKFNYALANDKTTLYAAIKLTDKMDQMRALNAGITLSIDTKGKKKESYSLTFPLAEPGSKPDFGKKPDDNTEITQQDRDDLMRERITKLRDIKVVGFTDIEGDMITTSNTYGVKAAIDYDADGNLIYEVAIPLHFFHSGDVTKTEWAFNFKINGIQKPKADGAEGDHQGGSGFSGGGGGRGGRGGGGGGMGGGGGRGGRGGRGGGGTGGGAESSRSELSKSTDFWEKFYLNNN
ncbi:hypothetical protein [Mucilaginibacter sp. FT3.2]|uniref:hypothetical protein n=1 Tax=Mucilaginibacter sp. FT3.2 TaxID=2723090 RepID=UPI00160C2679|nr:hypothetical protein [Mucilaginibacter sp. FT3.2]MBB6234485.1 hypothetical protein [Mucilaginibacter sp. FT3.2]